MGNLGVVWMKYFRLEKAGIHAYGFNDMVGDDMGSRPSVQIISDPNHLRVGHGVWK